MKFRNVADECLTRQLAILRRLTADVRAWH